MPYCKQTTLCHNPFFNMRPMAFPALKKKGLSLFGVGEWVGGVVVLVG